MKVIHIITRLIVGGAQENTLLNCRDLITQYGDDVTLVIGPEAGPEGSLLEQARDWGIPIEVVDSLRRAIHPTRDRLAYQALRRLIRQRRPDVVHTHSAKGGMLGRFAAHAERVPAIVHTVHGAPFHPYQGRGARWFFARCERAAAARCHRLISVADAMTELLVAAGVAPREKFSTIYSGMEVKPFLAADALRSAQRAELGYRDEHVVIGKIARLFHLKGHDDFLAAAEQVAAENPQVRFLLVGDGLWRESIEARIRRSILRDRVWITGLVPPGEIPAWLAAMDVVVHTSLREGLARVLPQALLAGRPVISFDVDGAREVVASDETGILLPPRDVAGLAAAMRRLAADPAMRARLAAEGRRRCTERFRHDNMTRQIRELYEATLEAGGVRCEV
ncbi:MAG: glycosyltransferase family 4 protein [Pirellulales bacterium]